MAKKEKNCDPADPADDRKGDTWDHVAIDAESRLVVSVVPGERTAENVVAVAPKPAPRPAAAQPSMNLDVTERAKPPRDDDDLQIPAFLRRQAN